eukprot:TRINITY_DN1387_c0_g1_i2.p1 TRINITY_DN1387_c0_g1~~TRINITY_DN1387_c0_g1_i2.p1  ORF type:complete len:751 (+),score=163.69 TRINITY_DN1387_c0_g1_i2:87-2339(+)
MEFEAEEDRNGVRFSFNTWPSSRIEGTRLVVPIGCMYTPLKPQALSVHYDPVTCKGPQPCNAVLNSFCPVDYRTKQWICPFCTSRNQLPPNYADISETNLPAELIAQYSTLDYVISRNVPAAPPVFVFLVDRCIPHEELQELKSSLIMALNLLPQNALIGLISVGKTVQLYESTFEEIPKSWAFSGTKDIVAKQVQEFLQLPAPPANGYQQAIPNRFLMPISEAEFSLTTILEELLCDPNPTKFDQRPVRSTGPALALAIALLETSFPNSGGRIMLFTGGPANQGPGMVTSTDLKEPLRAHADLVKDQAKYTKAATKYYEALGKRAVTNGHVVDIFACSYDQSGVYEMQDMVKKTGGLMVLADSFETPMFKQSFQRIFTRNDQGVIPMGFNATVEVLTSRELRVCGAIGHCSTLAKKSPFVSETEIGVGGTSAWKVNGIDPASTLAFFFEVANQHGNPIPADHRGLIQFQTTFQNANQQKILRVTTIGRHFGDPNAGNAPLIDGFDQEAGATLMARIVVFKAESEEAFDVLRWLDRMLIRFMNKFATYRKDDPSSFQLHPNLSVYPQFAFHLRRSNFLQVFNSSPDETAFFRYMLNRENVANCLIMIQPTLDAYSLSGPPVPVLLASTSVQPDRILVLDTFFRVILFHGETIVSWRDAGYANDPKYENLKLLLEAPKADCQGIMNTRFPLPRYVECDQGKSQARFLLAIIDPVITHTNPSQSSKAGEVVFTDDVPLKVFMEHLKKLAVQS